MRKYQRTIARPADLEGPGLFSGNQAKMTLRPADPDEGITFIRTDLPGRPRIQLSPETISSKFRRTKVFSKRARAIVVLAPSSTSSSRTTIPV